MQVSLSVSQEQGFASTLMRISHVLRVARLRQAICFLLSHVLFPATPISQCLQR